MSDDQRAFWNGFVKNALHLDEQDFINVTCVYVEGGDIHIEADVVVPIEDIVITGSFSV